MKKLIPLLLIATAAIAGPFPVVIITAPESVDIGDAQRSALMAAVKQIPDTGTYNAGEPVITSNTVTSVTYKDYVFTERQAGGVWDEARRAALEATCQSVNTNITVHRSNGYGAFMTSNDRVNP